MRVLITNTDLHQRGGVQTIVRTLARNLERHGHSIMAFGADPAEGPRLVQNDVVPVATDLEHLTTPPDIIHAQHHLDGMAALTALPAVPAIFHCHGATWRGTTFRHPRIYRYLAMSKTLASRIAIESNIDPNAIEVLLNCVELARFPEPRSLPARPATALFYNHRHRRGSATLDAIRTATARIGLALDIVGAGSGATTDRPERTLPNYDIVFASGLSALEALVSGCAVVVLGRTSCGPLVRQENYDALRQVNFSMAANSVPSTADAIEQQLRSYSNAHCAAVTAHARRDADADVYTRRLIAIYEAAIARHRLAPPSPANEMRAIARYLRGIVPLVKMTDRILERHWSNMDRATSIDDLDARLRLLERQAQATARE